MKVKSPSVSGCQNITFTCSQSRLT